MFQQVVEPAYAVTGVNNEEDFAWVLIQLGISAFIYFLVMPVESKFVTLFFYYYFYFDFLVSTALEW